MKRRRSLRDQSQQSEVQWADPEPFKLQVESSRDGDRMVQTTKQNAADRQIARDLQPPLL